MEDSRFFDVKRVKKKHLKSLGLNWFQSQIEEGYFTEDGFSVTSAEKERYAAFAKTCYEKYEATLDDVLAGSYRADFGLSPKLWSLAAETWRNRGLYPHVFGRFDVAGVLDNQPGKLIEFNADTATVLAEATLIQPFQLQDKNCWNDTTDAMALQLASIAEKRAEDDRAVLVITMGGGEDMDNAVVWKQAAERAGLACDVGHLPSVHFAPGEGVFRQLNADEWYRYGIVVKMIPWDWIDQEEPALLDDLATLIQANTTAIINPPFASLMQSKAMLAELSQRYRDDTSFLRAGWGRAPQGVGKHVTKPIFGREGENVAVVSGTGHTLETADGDYADQSRIWQSFTKLPTDSDGDIYQAGIYWAKRPCGLAFRRRDGLIIDEDSEFVPCAIQDY